MIEGISIDQIPASWRHVPLGSFCDFSGGTQPPKSTFKDAPSNGYVRLLQIRDFEKDKYAVYVPANKRLRIIESSDISIARYGASVGRILTGKSGAINVAIMTTHPDRSQVEKSFLGFALQHPDFQTYLTGLGGRAAQAGFNKGEVSRFKFPLPPLPEQRKIAAVLGVVQRAMEQQERLLALTTELKKALMHKLFTEGLRGEPQKQTEIGPLPESWGVAMLESVAVAFDYGTSVKCEHGKAGVPVLRIPNVVGGSIDLSDLKHGQPKRSELDQLRLQDGDLLFVRTNGVLENAGRCALYRGELEDCYFASYLIRVRVDSSMVLPAFVNEYARTERGRSFLSGRAIRTADGKFNINSGTLKRVLLPLPDIEEQKKVVRQLDLVDRKLKLHKRKQATLTALFRTLLHQLMTAQIRVHDLDLDVVECGDMSPHVTIRKVE